MKDSKDTLNSDSKLNKNIKAAKLSEKAIKQTTRKSRQKNQAANKPSRGVSSTDQHFDALAQPFMNNIYGSYKGRMRLALLRDDLFAQLQAGESLLDVGAGIAQLSIESHQRGLRVFALDAAAEMRQAAESFAQAQFSVSWQDRYAVCPMQSYSLPEGYQDGFDWVWCHAVLAWMQDPTHALKRLAQWVKPGGHLSVLFYNRDAMVLQQIFRGRYGYLEKMWARGSARTPAKPFYPGGLTPQTPLSSEWVREQLNALGLAVCFERGVRCFADYLQPEIRDRMTEEQLLTVERTYRTTLPYSAMGRYIHVVAKKPEAS